MKRTPYIHISIVLAFLANTLGPVPWSQAQEFRLPAPGVMVHLSPPLDPPILKGIKVHPDNPFRFDFILDQGDLYRGHVPREAGYVSPQEKQEVTRLIKYFLASLTIPEKDLWVNLSPYEKNRIIPQSFGLTEMGRDLLAEDYMLKQITASLIYPEDETGKKFWNRVYGEAEKKFGTTNIPVNTFNKVWIVPAKAVVYENAKAGTAYVVESKLKVMLEQDYLALEKNAMGTGSNSALMPILGQELVPVPNNVNALGSQIVREIVIPELTKEVNEDKNFSQLRQVYNSLILATWYKKKIKDSILERVYSDKNKIAGVGYKNSSSLNIDAIYQRYLQAFKKGVYNYIKEDIDPVTQETVPRKYFSGGVQFGTKISEAMTSTTQENLIGKEDGAMLIKADLAQSLGPLPADRSDNGMIANINREFLAGSKASYFSGNEVWGAIGPDGSRFFVKVNKNGPSKLEDVFWVYRVARALGAHVPDVKLIKSPDLLALKDLKDSFDQRKLRLKEALAMQDVKRYAAPVNQQYSGIEEAIVFSYLTNHMDLDLKKGHNAFRNKKNQYVLYDIDLYDEEEAEKILYTPMEGYWGVFDQIDIDRLVETVVKSKFMDLHNIAKGDVGNGNGLRLTTLERQKHIREFMMKDLEQVLNMTVTRRDFAVGDIKYDEFVQEALSRGWVKQISGEEVVLIKDINEIKEELRKIFVNPNKRKFIKLLQQRSLRRGLYSDKIRELLGKLKDLEEPVTPDILPSADLVHARPAFEQVRETVNGQDRLGPFVFYNARISMDDHFGGPAMFESLIKLLENEDVRKHYGLDLPEYAERTSPQHLLNQFKEQLKLLQKDLQPLIEGGRLSEIEQDNMDRDHIIPFLEKFFINTAFSTNNIGQFVFLLHRLKGFWTINDDGRGLDRLDLNDMYSFFSAMSQKGVIAQDNSPFMVVVPDLIPVLTAKGLISDEEGRKLLEYWGRLKTKYLRLINIPLNDLDKDSTGKRFLNPNWKNVMSLYFPNQEIGKFMGDYYGLTNAIYPILSKVFFTIAAGIEGHVYESQAMIVNELGQNWQIRTLTRGYYRDWDNVWQLEEESNRSSPPVNFLTYDGETGQLKDLFEEYPERMVEVFIQAAKRNVLIDEHILDAIRAVREIKKDKTDQVGRNFVEFMGLPQKIAPLLVRMHEIGLFEKIIPELGELKGHYAGPDHRFSLTYHTLYLLYYFENGMPQLLNDMHQEDVYQRVRDNFPSRLMLRFSILLHDAEKDPEFQHLGRPHPVGGANSLTHQVLERFPGMEVYNDWISWLVWHHQDLNARGRYSPSKRLYHRDLLDILSYRDIKASSTLMDIWYFLTIADAYSVDPNPGGKQRFLEPVVHDLYTNLHGYYSKADPEDRRKQEQEWRRQAAEEDREIKAHYKSTMTISDIRSAFETFRPYVDDDTLKRMEEQLINEVHGARADNNALGGLPVGSDFIRIYDDYVKLLDIDTYYLRRLNVRDNSFDMAHEMIMYALMRNSSDPNLILSRVTEVETELGILFNLTVNINHDREGIMYKIMGLMAALGLNVVNSQVRTLVKPNQKGKFIADQLEGYFLPGEVDFEALWPELKGLLMRKGVPFNEEKIMETGKPDIKQIVPILLKSLLTDQVTIDEIFEIKKTLNKFQIQQKNLKIETEIRFTSDVNAGGTLIASRSTLGAPDRNGLLYTVARIAGEGFGFNIEVAPILTSSAGVSDTFVFSKIVEGQARALTRSEKRALTEWYKFFLDSRSYDNNYLQKAVAYIKDDKYFQRKKSVDKFQRTFLPPDPAMSTPEIVASERKNTGGIDLTPANMDLQTQNAGAGIKFHLDPAMLKQLQNAPGFVPVIVSVEPLKDLRGFLGIIVNQT